MPLANLLIFMILITFNLNSAAHASFLSEVQNIKSNKDLLCPANRMQEPIAGFIGPMWSCKSEIENVKLYIRGKTDNPKELERIFVKAERPINSSFSENQKKFILNAIKHYAKKDAEKLNSNFFSCKNEKEEHYNNYSFHVSCYQGADIKSHTLEIKKL